MIPPKQKIIQQGNAKKKNYKASIALSRNSMIKYATVSMLTPKIFIKIRRVVF